MHWLIICNLISIFLDICLCYYHVTLIKENFINFIIDIYSMEGKYINLDKRLQEQNPRHPVGQDPCKILGYVCIPEEKYRRKGPTFPMPIVEPDPNKENDGIYKILPIMEPNQNKNLREGYVWIPERGQIMVPRKYIPIRTPGEIVYIPRLGYGFIPYKHTLNQNTNYTLKP